MVWAVWAEQALDLEEGRRVARFEGMGLHSTTRWRRRHPEVSLLDNLDFSILIAGENGGIQ